MKSSKLLPSSNL